MCLFYAIIFSMIGQEISARFGIEDVINAELNYGECHQVDLPNGDVFGGRSLYIPHCRLEAKLISILGPCAGWLTHEHDQGGVCAAMPDLERFLNACMESATPIKLVDEAKCIINGKILESEIPAEVYGRVILEDEAHPVSVVADLGLYCHDIGADHLPAPAVVGKGLFELLIPASGKKNLVRVARAYDEATPVIISSVSDYLKATDKNEIILTARRREDVERILGLSPKRGNLRLDKLEELIRLGLERLEVI